MGSWLQEMGIDITYNVITNVVALYYALGVACVSFARLGRSIIFW